MYKRLLLATSLLLTIQARAIDFPLEVVEYLDDSRIVAFVPEAEIAAAGTWDLRQGPPPLDIAHALRAVGQALAAYHVDLLRVGIVSIELKELPHRPGHWHYLVQLRGKAGKTPHPRFFVVLMNGRAIPAILEPEAYK